MDIVQSGGCASNISLRLPTPGSLSSFYIFQRLHLLDLLYEVSLLIVELFVF